MKKKHSITSFKDLKEIVEKDPSLFQKRKPIQENSDDDVFQEAMADVREIKEFRKLPVSRPPKIKPKNVKKDDAFSVLKEIVDGKKKITLSDTSEYIEWVCPNTSKDIARKLHMGSYSVQDFIDLHGMTRDEAEEAFSAFFKKAVRTGLFCIKVIHGRGLRSPKGPVLKKALEQWLNGNLRKWVLAYSTAKDCDGGLGATYIILK
jgi:DNA-nicking Smr family endonuclease